VVRSASRPAKLLQQSAQPQFHKYIARDHGDQYCERPGPSLSALANLKPRGTNVSPAKPGLIAELSVPEDPEAARIILSQLVRE